MPAHLYVRNDDHNDLYISNPKIHNGAPRQRYIRYDLHRKALDKIKALQEQLDDILDDRPLPPVQGCRRFGSVKANLIK